MSAIDEALETIKKRLAEIEAEREELLVAVRALTSGQSSVGASRGIRQATVRRNTARRGRAAGSARAPRGANRAKILDSIASSAKTAATVSRETGIPATTVASTLTALKKAGLAEKRSPGYIAAPPAQRRRRRT